MIEIRRINLKVRSLKPMLFFLLLITTSILQAQSEIYTRGACATSTGRAIDYITLYIIGKPSEYEGGYSIIQRVYYLQNEQKIISHAYPYFDSNEKKRYYIIVNGKKYHFSF